MNSANLKPNSILTGERNYEAALAIVIARAERELLIFDQHLKFGAYHSAARHTQLHDFLKKSPQNRLTIILHEAEFLNNHCPRLCDLLKMYGHSMQVLLTNDNAKVAKDCLVIADNLHTVRRIHIDHARFKFTLDDAETAASLRQRFDEILAEVAEPVTITTIGL